MPLCPFYSSCFGSIIIPHSKEPIYISQPAVGVPSSVAQIPSSSLNHSLSLLGRRCERERSLLSALPSTRTTVCFCCHGDADRYKWQGKKKKQLCSSAGTCKAKPSIDFFLCVSGESGRKSERKSNNVQVPWLHIGLC